MVAQLASVESWEEPGTAQLRRTNWSAPAQGKARAHQEAMTECLRPESAGSRSNRASSRRSEDPEVEMENCG